MGCSGIQELRNRGIPVEAVEGIFITHMHGDHTNGNLPSVLELKHTYPLKLVTDGLEVIL